VSRFIRSGEERDLQVAWEDVPKDGGPDAHQKPVRAALCSVPFLSARDWLCGPETNTRRSPNLAKGRRAWVWDYLEGEWRRPKRMDLYPGQVLVVAAETGGYDAMTGWDPEAKDPVPLVPSRKETAQESADSAQDAEDLSSSRWKTIARHGYEAGQAAAEIATQVGLEKRLVQLLELAGRWHDAGKAHGAFQGSIRSEDRPRRSDLAKAPPSAWPRRHLYQFADGSDVRRGFRHELASTLALFAVLRRYKPDHPALLGPWSELLTACGTPAELKRADGEPGPLEREVLALDVHDFNLVAFLVCSHHGKVRARWYAAPADQTYRARRSEDMPIRGVREGDVLPAIDLSDAAGEAHVVPEVTLTLAPASAGLSPRTGASWIDRVHDLLQAHGPFTLAWLEAILRAADVRASRLETPDPLLTQEVLA
ncbi:hypothetical protein HY251_07805, partial [bacterium]|nr:hypothetical protein [bacterium]